MSNLETVELNDLVQRYEQLIKVYVPLAAEVGEKLDKFGKIRQELQVIAAEFARRKYTPEEPEKLVKMIQDALGSRPTEAPVEK